MALSSPSLSGHSPSIYSDRKKRPQRGGMDRSVPFPLGAIYHAYLFPSIAVCPSLARTTAIQFGRAQSIDVARAYREPAGLIFQRVKKSLEPIKVADGVEVGIVPYTLAPDRFPVVIL